MLLVDRAAEDEARAFLYPLGHRRVGVDAVIDVLERATAIDEERSVPTAEDMIAQLADANEICSRSLREAIKAADDADDVKTADLLTQRIGQHEQNVWMLRAMLAR